MITVVGVGRQGFPYLKVYSDHLIPMSDVKPELIESITQISHIAVHKFLNMPIFPVSLPKLGYFVVFRTFRLILDWGLGLK